MPFSGTIGNHNEAYWTQHYNLLKKVIEELGDLDVHRSEPLRENILKAIIADLIVSEVVVAELTDFNANVFWELGVRQSFKHGTVTIAEHGTHLPFDQMEKATLFYKTAPAAEWETFRGQLKAAVKDCLENPSKPDSPVLDNITGRGTIFELFRRDESIRRLDALLSEIDHNIKLLGMIVKQASENKAAREKGGEIRCVTDRLKTTATELLIANRYLDEDKRFFKLAENAYTHCLAINDELAIWSNQTKGADNWLSDPESVNRWNLRFSEYRENIIRIREKLGRRL